MKTFLLACFIAVSTVSWSQTTEIVREVVTLMPEQSIYLNSTSHGYFKGGKSRTTYKIDLPTNTIEWYYIYSTSPNRSGSQSLNLIKQLSNVLDPTGVTSIAVSAIAAPPGTGGIVDVYVMGYKNYLNFEEKDMFGAWAYSDPGGWPEGKTENARQGTKKIDDVRSGTVYLGLKNPHVEVGVNVTFEVAAIVEKEVVDYSEWSIEVKNQIFNSHKEELIASHIDANVANDIATCFLEKLVNNYSPEDFLDLSEAESNSIGLALEEECLVELRGGPKSAEEQKGETVAGMGWHAYEKGDLEKAITYSKKALEYDPSISWAHGNLGLFYLIKNDEFTALEHYLEAISLAKQDRIHGKEIFVGLIKDIEDAEKAYPDLVDHEEILEQLKVERDNM